MITTSVLLSTYNGEKYLTEQLDSIKNQTKRVDEVIIKDDCSTDGTVALIEQYIDDYKLDNWKILINKTNLGWKKNFVSMLEYVNTDYFFFCDQDDIWYHDKVENMMKIVSKNEQIEVLLSDFYPFYENGKEPKRNKKLSGHTIKYSQNNFLLNRYPGCTMCLKKSVIPIYNKFWNDLIPHDSFAMLYGLASESVYLYDCFTMYYRRHSSTATHSSVNNRIERIHETDYYIKLLKLYKKMSNNSKTNDVSNWISIRRNALIRKKPIILLKNLKYLKLYWSINTYIMDFICAMGIR